MTIRDITALLIDPGRSGSPEPSLLPWLTQWSREQDMPIMARAAMSVGYLDMPTGWPAITDAVADVLAAHVHDPAVLAEVVDALPAVAGRVSSTPIDRIRARPDALAYAALIDPQLLAEAQRVGQPAWRVVLANASRSLSVPPLADIRSLAALVKNSSLTPIQALYLLPFRPRETLAAIPAITAAARNGAGWYTAALIARALPYLDGTRRAELDAVVGTLPKPWSDHLAGLLSRPHRPWRSAVAELAASHPATVGLAGRAPTVDPTKLAELCIEMAHRIVAEHGTAVRWESTDIEEPPRRTGPIRSGREYGLTDMPIRHGTAGISGRPRRTRGPQQTGRWVSTGLATPDRPDRSWPRSRCASPDSDYLYWFAVNDAPDADAIDDRRVPLELPDDAAAGTVLTVALFNFPGEIDIVPGSDVGELVLRGDGTVAVHRQPGTVDGERLLFPIRTPSQPGRYRLRCSLYRSQTLLQSRLVEIQVAPGAPWRSGGLRSTTDYVVDTTLDPVELAGVEPLTLSVFMNDNGDGTHGFRFFGDNGSAPLKADVLLGATELQDHITRARAALAAATWVGGGEWQQGIAFRYDGRREADLATDLIRIARAGYRLWTGIAGRVARERNPEPNATTAPIASLQNYMRAPGTIEFATKYNAALTIPAALFYDYLLDTNLDLTVCRTAMRAIDFGANLADEPCFQGRCPEHREDSDNDSVVCPGGFWGFRHRIGLPQSVRTGTATEPPAGPPSSGISPIRFAGRPHCVVGVATEFAGSHPTAVSKRGNDSSRVYADRAQLLAALRTGSAPHLVYLFCHGEISPAGLPGLRIGQGGSPAITTDQIDDGTMWWPHTRPLVILNGCRTAAVEPRYALNFVNAFVRGAAASGVIGTEVTIYETLAMRFADLMLDAFFTPGVMLAEAMRCARLALLAQGNPLGLIYVAYAAPQLRLSPVPTATEVSAATP